MDTDIILVSQVLCFVDTQYKNAELKPWTENKKNFFSGFKIDKITR